MPRRARCPPSSASRHRKQAPPRRLRAERSKTVWVRRNSLPARRRTKPELIFLNGSGETIRNIEHNRVGGFHVRTGRREDQQGFSNSGQHESLGVGRSGATHSYG